MPIHARTRQTTKRLKFWQIGLDRHKFKKKDDSTQDVTSFEAK